VRKIILSPLIGYPKWKGRCSLEDNFTSVKIPRFIEPVGLAEIQVGANGVSNLAIDVDLHTTTNNFAPNEYRGIVNPSGVVVYKGSNTK